MGAKSLPEVAKRLSRFSGKVDALFVEHANVIERMPENFVLVVLPYDDGEALDYSLSLVPKNAGKPVVYALMRGRRVTFLLPEGPLEVDLEAAFTAG